MARAHRCNRLQTKLPSRRRGRLPANAPRRTDQAGRVNRPLIDIGAVVVQSGIMLYIRETAGRGRGVYASAGLRRGDIIERAPVIVLPDPEWLFLESTLLRDYHYAWGSDAAAIVLGFGSIYNHSYSPNACYIRRFDERIMEYVAIRDISPEEEITVNYNGSPNDRSPLWFDPDHNQLCRTA